MPTEFSHYRAPSLRFGMMKNKKQKAAEAAFSDLESSTSRAGSLAAALREL
jgi:hypothetical protein